MVPLNLHLKTKINPMQQNQKENYLNQRLNQLLQPKNQTKVSPKQIIQLELLQKIKISLRPLQKRLVNYLNLRLNPILRCRNQRKTVNQKQQAKIHPILQKRMLLPHQSQKLLQHKINLSPTQIKQKQETYTLFEKLGQPNRINYHPKKQQNPSHEILPELSLFKTKTILLPIIRNQTTKTILPPNGSRSPSMI
uniref:Uncharacterized protein n=1 Tax=Cacopsylla melanoneura TaxID=428564 RepID=A0A8D8LFK0_9HEMI